MIFTILISIVFIAELIIAGAIIFWLKRICNIVQDLDSTLSLIKPSVKDISVLVKKISGQALEFVNNFVEKQEEAILRNVSKALLGTLLFRKFKKSKVFKLVGKGLSLLEIMV